MEKKDPTPHINVDFFEDLTGDISEESRSGVEEIGKRIRLLREEKGLSVKELSKLTGFDIEFFDILDVSVERQFDAAILGYGRKTLGTI